jgi:uncharacterized protein (TIGR02246 family)
MRAMTLMFCAAIISTSAFAGNADVAAQSSLWAADWSHRKLDDILQLYAPDPTFLPTSGERWAGAAVIRKNFAAALQQFSADLRLHSVRSDASGTLAYDSGTYTESLIAVKDGRTMQLKGNYLFVFRLQNGHWKIEEQTFTEFDPSKL